MVSLPRCKQQKKREDGRGVATSLERTDIGMGMGIRDDKPLPPLFPEKNKKTGGGGHQPSLEGMGMGKHATLSQQKKKKNRRE